MPDLTDTTRLTTIQVMSRRVPFWAKVLFFLGLLVGIYLAIFPVIELVARGGLMLFGFSASAAQADAQALAAGARITLNLTALAGVCGLGIGLLAATARMSKRFYLREPARLFIAVIRGTPALVQILFAYSAIPLILDGLLRLLGSDSSVQSWFNSFWAALFALSLNVGAYNAEVIRSAILSVPHGQWEAASALAFKPRQTFGSVILAQAGRIAIPPLVNNLISLLKDSSLASVIALLDLTLVGQRIVARTFQPIEVLTIVALTYLLLTFVLTFFSNQLEKRLSVAHRR